MIPKKNHLPPELAAQLLERSAAEIVARGAPLTALRVTLDYHAERPDVVTRSIACADLRLAREFVAQCSGENSAGYTERVVGETVEFVTGPNAIVPGVVFARAVVHPSTASEPNPAQREVLALLAEEAAEVVQASTKIARFGACVNPWTGVHNTESLASELGDLLAVVELAIKYDLVDRKAIAAACARKIAAFKNGSRLRVASARGIE